MLGSKELIPGSAQWYEASNASVPNSQHYKHKCWICDDHVLSVIFWSRKYAFRLNPVFTSASGNGKEAELIRFEIDRIPAGMFESEEGKLDPGLGHTDGSLTYEEMENKVPYLAGSFTGWRYMKMKNVFDLCTECDTDYTEPYERC